MVWPQWPLARIGSTVCCPPSQCSASAESCSADPAVVLLRCLSYFPFPNELFNAVTAVQTPEPRELLHIPLSQEAKSELAKCSCSAAQISAPGSRLRSRKTWGLWHLLCRKPEVTWVRCGRKWLVWQGQIAVERWQWHVFITKLKQWNTLLNSNSEVREAGFRRYKWSKPQKSHGQFIWQHELKLPEQLF